MAKKTEEIIKEAMSTNSDPSVIDANKQVLMDAFNQQKATAAAAGVDPTQQPQATSQADVLGQDSKTRLWQSLENSYDQQRRQSNESFDKAISQTDRQLLSRGMQRSSYAGQTLANLQNQKVEAENQITGNQIADFQNRLNTLEQQEKEDERWERQWAYQQERDTIADQQWQQQFQAQQDQWKQQFDYNKMTTEQQMAYNYIIQMLEKGDKPSDALLKQAGISRKDYEQMKTSAKKTGGGRGRGGSQNPNGTNDPNYPGLQNGDDPYKQLQLGLVGTANRDPVSGNVGTDERERKYGTGTKYGVKKTTK